MNIPKADLERAIEAAYVFFSHSKPTIAKCNNNKTRDKLTIMKHRFIPQIKSRQVNRSDRNKAF